ncbi:TetR/AcrR family transcriptional regulator [Amycolatopsis cihanbeyliensis]|uniref:TetR family transcriptional regulator n=1 Tax=Amycolatopsis cihanbeyliensis TaxID=1128664 RepID=A0A542DQM0_AMYCI|nr:TetR/AcrR family transcriptional regulator [Amycolatopsis cihanbeyliensis]TQJ05400.1 TetR family transcriptional regulator [Amycolatopsis cihanbeyliensis]
MAGRRTDTRENIQRIALELFTEQGYERTSLREIADRLGVTKAALYYHYRTKDDIILGLIDNLGAQLDEVIAWGRAQRDPAGMRVGVLRRFAALVESGMGALMRCMQQNQAAMRELDVKRVLSSRLSELFELLCAGETDQATQLRIRLSLVAVLFGHDMMFGGGVSVPYDSGIVLGVAMDLASVPAPQQALDT